VGKFLDSIPKWILALKIPSNFLNYLLTLCTLPCVDVQSDYGTSTIGYMQPMEIGTMKLTTSTSLKENFTFFVGEQGTPKCTPEGEGEVGSKKFTMDVDGDQTNLGF
jgi:hypothetical protein